MQVEREKTAIDEIKVGDLGYGQCCEFNGSVYAKVNKREVGQYMAINWTDDYCVLYNAKIGSLRALHGDTTVKAVKGVLHTHPIYTAEAISEVSKR